MGCWGECSHHALREFRPAIISRIICNSKIRLTWWLYWKQTWQSYFGLDEYHDIWDRGSLPHSGHWMNPHLTSQGVSFDAQHWVRTGQDLAKRCRVRLFRTRMGVFCCCCCNVFYLSISLLPPFQSWISLSVSRESEEKEYSVWLWINYKFMFWTRF